MVPTEDTGVLVKNTVYREALNGGVLTTKVFHVVSNCFPLSVLISVLLAESVQITLAMQHIMNLIVVRATLRVMHITALEAKVE